VKLGSPTKVEIKPNAEKTEFRFLLTFPGRPQLVEFVLTGDGMMSVMGALQELQALHKIPIPKKARPFGKPWGTSSVFRAHKKVPPLQSASIYGLLLQNARGQGKMTLKLTTTARKLKVTMMIDAAPFAALRAIPDSAPSRTDVTITVGDRAVSADLATKSVRKAVKTLIEHGPPGRREGPRRTRERWNGGGHF
jgi:hypothetical protein